MVGRAETASFSGLYRPQPAARDRQIKRYSEHKTKTNSVISGKALRRFCALNGDSEKLMAQAMDQLSLSARAHDKLLRLSRTIADLAGEESIGTEHLVEALQYREILYMQ